MRDRGISVLADMGFQVPKAYFEAVMKTQPTSYGCVIKKDPNVPEAFLSHLAKSPQLDTLLKMNTAMEGYRIVHWFGYLPANTLLDNIQPFRLLTNPKGQCILSATLTGDFTHHLDTPQKMLSKHTPEWWCANQKLLPKVQQIYRLVKEDTAALQAELANNMRSEITELIGPQGGVIKLILFSQDDTVIWDYIKSMPTYKRFPWGNTTDTLDYVPEESKVETKATEVQGKASTSEEAAPVQSVAKVKKKNKFLAAVSTEGESNDEVSPPKEAKGDEVKAVEASPPVTGDDKGKLQAEAKAPIIVNKERQIVMADGATIVVTEFKGKTEIVMYPNVFLTSRKPLRKHYMHYCGRTLSNNELDQRVGVRVSNAEVLKEVEKRLIELQSIGPPGSDAARSKPANTEAKETVSVKNKATGEIVTQVVTDPPTEPAHSSIHEDRTHVEGGSYIAMSNKQKYDVNKHLKSLTDGGVSLVNPHLDQELEDTVEQFFKQIGYKSLDQTFGWKYETRLQLAKLAPEAMAIWSGDLLRMIRNLNKDLESLTDPDVMEQSRKTA